MSTVQSSTGSLSLATGDLNLTTQTGTITLESDSSSATAIQINTPDAASGMSFTCAGSTGFSFNGVNGGFSINTAGLGVNDSGSTNITSTNNFNATGTGNANIKAPMQSSF